MAGASYPKENKSGLDAEPDCSNSDVIDWNLSLVYIYTL